MEGSAAVHSSQPAPDYPRVGLTRTLALALALTLTLTLALALALTLTLTLALALALTLTLTLQPAPDHPLPEVRVMRHGAHRELEPYTWRGDGGHRPESNHAPSPTRDPHWPAQPSSRHEAAGSPARAGLYDSPSRPAPLPRDWLSPQGASSFLDALVGRDGGGAYPSPNPNPNARLDYDVPLRLGLGLRLRLGIGRRLRATDPDPNPSQATRLWR